MQRNMAGFTYRQEIYRKAIHLSSLWMPLAIYWLPRSLAAMLLGAALIAVLSFEVFRKHPQRQPGKLLNHIFGYTIRQHESAPGLHLTGASYVLIAAFIVCLAFPKPIAITALTIMLTADTAAALVGRRYGRTRILDKSLEGCAAFLVTALLCVSAIAWITSYGGHFVMAGFVAAITATAAELVSGRLHIDDNLTITLAAACSMWLVMHV